MFCDGTSNAAAAAAMSALSAAASSRNTASAVRPGCSAVQPSATSVVPRVPPAVGDDVSRSMPSTSETIGPCAVAQVGAGLAVDPLEEEVGDVRPEVGQPPGQVGGVADDHPGEPGERETGDGERTARVDLGAVQAHLRPDAGCGDRQVRIVGQQGLAAGGVLTGDDPGVGADALAIAEQVRDGIERRAGGLEGAAQVGAEASGEGAGVPGRGCRRVLRRGDDLLDDRGVLHLRVAREELVDLVDVAEGREGQATGQLVVVVRMQVPGHRLEPGEGVDRVPRLGLLDVHLQAEHRVLHAEGVRAAGVKVGVHPVGVGLQVDIEKPEPWDPIDSLAWLKAMAWDLHANYDDELTRGLAYATLRDVDQVDELFPRYPQEQHAPIIQEVVAATQDATAAATGDTGTFTGGLSPDLT